jgi:hypothetical protein
MLYPTYREPTMPKKDLIPYEMWMERTKVFGRPRSDLLKALDQELERYEKSGGGAAALKQVRQALEMWKKSKGPGDAWRRSDRNKKDRAVEELDARLSDLGDTDKYQNQAPAFMHAELAHTRLGVVYLFSQTKVDTSVFDVVLESGLDVMSAALDYGGPDIAGKAIAIGGPAVVVSAEDLHKASEFVADIQASPQTRTTLQKVRDYLKDFIDAIIRQVKEKFGDFEASAAMIKSLINVCMKFFAKEAAPWVGGALDMAGGVAATLKAVITRFNTWKQGQGVRVIEGHPGVIVDSLKRAMTMSLFEGLYDTIKGAGMTALNVATAGAAMIIQIVTALIEMIVKIVWRLAEVSHMDKVFGQAREYWKQRYEHNGIHTKPYEFTSWYRKSALNTPALSVITLNSGICGDKMHFLKMFSEDGKSVISQGDFDRGVAFVDGLKGYGADYLENCAYKFSSDDPYVTRLLDFAKSHTGTLQSSGNKPLDTILKFAAA